MKYFLLLAFVAMVHFNAMATTYHVTSTTDGTATNQLRGAFQAANATAGPHIINIDAGTYTLTSGQLFIGDVNSQSVTVVGAGSSLTIIDGGNADRIIQLDQLGTKTNVVFSVTGVRFTNGKESTDTYGGGAFQGYGTGDNISFTNCDFLNNSSVSNGGPGGALSVGHGTLTITDCTFTGNSNSSTSDVLGGAIGYELLNTESGNLSITGCTFTNNSALSSAGKGGAIAISTQGYTGSTFTFAATINKNNFVNNHANTSGGEGGAIYVLDEFSNSTTTINYNRFFGNTATLTAARTAVSVNNSATSSGTVDVNNNWWGCNGGPASCADKGAVTVVAGGFGTNLFTTWLQLKTTAAAASICTSTGTTITSGFTSNSASSAISAANLSALVGVGITFSATLGSISGAQTTIQASGTATATYTAGGSTGSGTVNAVVDNVPGSDATARATIIISTLGTWLGGTSTAWSNTANWGCNTLPTGSTDVVIPSGTTFSPQVDITTAVTNNLTINSGATLSFSGSTNILTINGALTNSGTFTATSGKVVFNGTTQTIPALTYKDLQINGGGNKTLGGSTTVNGALTLTSGFILLGVNNLTIGSAGSISGGGSGSFVVTNSTGDLIQQNIGTAGRTGAILFPVGTGTGSYTPVSLNNTGTADNFTVGMLSSVYATYDASSNPTSAALTSDAVGKTWLISEAVGGGSTATATFQWNAADELSGFDRTNCFGSHFVNGGWNKGATSAAGGANPYTQTLTGLISFSPFGVGSANSPLPLKVLALSGNARGVSNELQWTTTNENGAEIFDIERGEDAANFHSITSLSAKGGTSAPDNHYVYTDQNPVIPLSYYRIRMNDHGKLSYSNTVLIHQYEMAFTIDAGPNPFGDKLEIGLRNMPPAAGLCTILLTDAGGRVVRQTSILASTGNTSLSLEGLGGLAPGAYFLRVDAGQSARTIKVMKGQ